MRTLKVIDSHNKVHPSFSTGNSRKPSQFVGREARIRGWIVCHRHLIRKGFKWLLVDGQDLSSSSTLPHLLPSSPPPSAPALLITAV